MKAKRNGLTNFHEQFADSEVPLPSERSTGLVFAVIAGLIALIWYRSPSVWVPATFIAGTLALLSFRAPGLLRPLNRLWFRLSMLLFKITNPVVMLLMYAIAIVPAGLIMQLLRDPLQAKPNPAAKTYWLDKTDPPASMQNQF